MPCEAVVLTTAASLQTSPLSSLGFKELICSPTVTPFCTSLNELSATLLDQYAFTVLCFRTGANLTSHTHTHGPTCNPLNVAAESPGLQLRIRKVPSSNLRPGTGHRDRSFPQPVQANAGMVRPLPSISFPIHYSLIIASFDIIQSELLSASLNKP
jgi:hypothetical protein